MKTAHEFWYAMPIGAIQGIAAIEARDAEHRAELLKLQDDLLQAANREVAMEATIEQLGKDGAVLATENERLKRELELAKRAWRETEKTLADTLAAYDRLKGELAEARGLLQERVSGETCIPCGRCITCRTLDFLSRSAAPQSTPSCTASAGSCNSPKACGEAGSCIDARMREVVAPADLMGALKQAFAKKFEPAPPDDIRTSVRRDIAAALRDHDRRLAALEAKGEPGTHACDCQEEYCQLRSGLPLTAAHPVHCKGAKP